MKKINQAAIMIAVAGILFMATACQTPAGRTTGQVVDDATITTKVKAKIFDQSILRGFAISVDTFEGTVTLTGAVKSEEQKEEAGNAAATVNGVKAVNNLLEIKKD
jgi:hyperosmotically inducible periplasmic protein